MSAASSSASASSPACKRQALSPEVALPLTPLLSSPFAAAHRTVCDAVLGEFDLQAGIRALVGDVCGRDVGIWPEALTVLHHTVLHILDRIAMHAHRHTFVASRGVLQLSAVEAALPTLFNEELLEYALQTIRGSTAPKIDLDTVRRRLACTWPGDVGQADAVRAAALCAEYVILELAELAHGKFHRPLRAVHLAEAAVGDAGLAALLLPLRVGTIRDEHTIEEIRAEDTNNQDIDQLEDTKKQPMDQLEDTMKQPMDQLEDTMKQPMDQLEDTMKQPMDQLEDTMKQPMDQLEDTKKEDLDQLEVTTSEDIEVAADPGHVGEPQPEAEAQQNQGHDKEATDEEPLIAIRYWNMTPDQCEWNLWGLDSVPPAFTLWNVGVVPSDGGQRGHYHLTTDMASRRELWKQCAEITALIPDDVKEVSDADFPWELSFLPRSLLAETAGHLGTEAAADLLLRALGASATPTSVQVIPADRDCLWDSHYYAADESDYYLGLLKKATALIRQLCVPESLCSVRFSDDLGVYPGGLFVGRTLHGHLLLVHSHRVDT